jgi:hypothetical protein
VSQLSEEDIVRMLGELAESSSAYRRVIEEYQSAVEQLAEDYRPAALLHQSMVVAVAEPGRLGTPRHLEQLAVAALRGGE